MGRHEKRRSKLRSRLSEGEKEAGMSGKVRTEAVFVLAVIAIIIIGFYLYAH